MKGILGPIKQMVRKRHTEIDKSVVLMINLASITSNTGYNTADMQQE